MNIYANNSSFVRHLVNNEQTTLCGWRYRYGSTLISHDNQFNCSRCLSSLKSIGADPSDYGFIYKSYLTNVKSLVPRKRGFITSSGKFFEH